MRGKVFWSEAERRIIARRAIETQRSRPDLSGLPLLREAMKALPVNRRRKLVTLTQVDWFEEAVATESRIARAVTPEGVQPVGIVWPEGNPYLPYFREIAEAHRNTNEAVAKLIELQKKTIDELVALRTAIQKLAPARDRSSPRTQPATSNQKRASHSDDR